MRETNRTEILNSVNGSGFHKIYLNPGLKEIIDALHDTMQQKKAALLFSGDLYRGDDWQHIPLLPENWLDFPAAVQRFDLIRIWGKWVPHLFRPVKTIYAGYSRSSAFIHLTDLLFGYDFHKKTVRSVMDRISAPGLQYLRNVPSLIFQDSIVNVSRLKIRLLREIFDGGGVVITRVDIRQKEGQLELTDQLTGGSWMVEGTPEPVSSPGSIRYMACDTLPWKRFSVRFRKNGNTFVWQEMGSHTGIYVLPHQDESLILEFMHDHGLSSSGMLSTPVEKKIEYPVLYSDIRRGMKRWLIQEVKKRSGDVLVEDLLETAYDIAKQTGIGFREFSSLYFRYGQQIEWLTDVVYEKMAETRNPEALWLFAEQLFQVRYEWAVETTGN